MIHPILFYLQKCNLYIFNIGLFITNSFYRCFSHVRIFFKLNLMISVTVRDKFKSVAELFSLPRGSYVYCKYSEILIPRTIMHNVKTKNFYKS